MEIYKLDSIEEGVAAMESPEGLMLYFSAERLPENSKTGDCFTLENKRFVFQKEETEKRRAAISVLLDGLMNKK
ncbi:MAG: DUF3006 domain-containing protein [Oscillospiraceae bacterium]|nr:DUF3006 domain-containing protein [Oscillospiraceae bacterium]